MRPARERRIFAAARWQQDGATRSEPPASSLCLDEMRDQTALAGGESSA